ncbi:cyclic nucleotide-gated ion channel 1-like [Tripterygium wilfordii]|uniref:Cyclic nucleotide-gated ion channel 1-like n=1 Tax=Tripterygium wilfordii TaxID=458696 RepID=A0A7J7CHI6_TRIWF|nr:cyclic nucleotide-gated ion channel 1-like [Tripterygium wilfordii]XP_038682146.1 cyclic nucleotide-gated ion channel 1-like [Tripterygium wilfordii]KAF5733520.1 cyclic nucleotide-gated ion channel 1-like [Tripterygium wilfordii]
MNLNRNKFLRFQDSSSEKFYSWNQRIFPDDGFYATKVRPFFSDVLEGIRRVYEKGSDRITRLKKPISSHFLGDYPGKKSKSKKKILDPQDPFLQKWNKIFILLCAIAVSLDPLFFYIPLINDDKKCLDLDRPLEIVACVLRTFVDVFYVLHIIFQFRTGFIAPSSRVFGRGELVDDPLIIAKRYLSSFFLVDVLSVLPIPQVVVLFVIPKTKGPVSLVTKDLLKLVIFSQYVPRLIRIYPLYKEIARTSGILTETAWAGAAFNLFLYMLASHVVGAFWYMFSIDRENRCWLDACKGPSCNPTFLYCEDYHADQPVQYAFLNSSCPLLSPDDIENSTTFNFGIFIDALQSRVVESMDFPQKFFYCFWWGLRNLSSLGQNLKTSTFVWEIFFAIFISVFGLVLFALLIGNMQKYLESTTVRVEEMRVRMRDAEQWMSHRMLPQELKERIRRYEQYKWQVTRGVGEETLIRKLPKDIRRDIKRHLCLDLLRRVPIFEKMDEQLLDAMCDRLKPVLYTEKSFIFREGDPCDEMLFVMRGTLVTMTTNGGRTGFFNSVYLKPGDVCGEGLLTWALDPQSSNLPISTRTVQALTEVEAFSLMAEDLKFVATQFRRLHSKQLQHTFRFYSVQWRTWATCFIQAAWRKHCRRKLNKSLYEAENRLQDALAKESDASPSLGATIYASRFAANALRILRQKGAGSSTRLPQRILPLLPQKPAEPDFSAEHH